MISLSFPCSYLSQTTLCYITSCLEQTKRTAISSCIKVRRTEQNRTDFFIYISWGDPFSIYKRNTVNTGVITWMLLILLAVSLTWLYWSDEHNFCHIHPHGTRNQLQPQHPPTHATSLPAIAYVSTYLRQSSCSHFLRPSLPKSSLDGMS